MRQRLYGLKNKKYPKTLKSVEGYKTMLENPENLDFCFTQDNKDQLYVGTVIKKDFSYMVYASYKTIDMIEKHIGINQRRYLMDGTFRVVPRGFKQLLIICIEFQNDVSNLFL